MIQFQMADFGAVWDRFRAGATRSTEIVSSLLDQFSLQFGEAYATALRQVTPRSYNRDPDATGPSLADSTIPVGFLVSGPTLEFALDQPAESAPNWDGSGGGVHYGQFVREGRESITAPSDGPWSTGKMALRTPWGPRKSVGPAEADPYQHNAIPGEETAFEMIARSYSAEVAQFLLGGISG